MPSAQARCTVRLGDFSMGLPSGITLKHLARYVYTQRHPCPLPWTPMPIKGHVTPISHPGMLCRKTTYGFTRPSGKTASYPGLPAAAPRMPVTCVSAGQTGRARQDGTAAVWAPSLLARLEKLIIELWASPPLPAAPLESSLAPSHALSQWPCLQIVRRNFYRRCALGKRAGGGQEGAGRGMLVPQGYTQTSAASLVNLIPLPKPPSPWIANFIPLCSFLQCYRLISLFWRYDKL